MTSDFERRIDLNRELAQSNSDQLNRISKSMAALFIGFIVFSAGLTTILYNLASEVEANTAAQADSMVALNQVVRDSIPAQIFYPDGPFQVDEVTRNSVTMSARVCLAPGVERIEGVSRSRISFTPPAEFTDAVGFPLPDTLISLDRETSDEVGCTDFSMFVTPFPPELASILERNPTKTPQMEVRYAVETQDQLGRHGIDVFITSQRFRPPAA